MASAPLSGSFFASHPTFKERIGAVMDYPDLPQEDTSSALELLDDTEELEKELTAYLTQYIHSVHQLQMQASAAQ